MRSATLIKTAAISLACAVALGAFGAHGLRTILEAHQRVQTFETGIKYMIFSFLGMFLLGVLHLNSNQKPLVIGAWLLWAGGLIFGLSLFFLSIFNLLWLGAVAPLGGLGMIAGWASVVLTKFKK